MYMSIRHLAQKIMLGAHSQGPPIAATTDVKRATSLLHSGHDKDCSNIWWAQQAQIERERERERDRLPHGLDVGAMIYIYIYTYICVYIYIFTLFS